MSELDIIIKFVEGDITIAEFMNELEINRALQNLLREKMPKTLLYHRNIQISDNDIVDCFQKTLCWRKIGDASNIHYLANIWLQENNILTNPTQIYGDKFVFLISVMPAYINGEQAESLIDEIIQSVPETMSKTKRIKEIKAKIKEAFHVEDKKYPRWAQDTDWPFSKTGKPLKYVSRKTDGDLVQHTFVDVDTGEETIVEEFY